ncbi:MAG: hypothetical protein K9M07_02100 [Simkaniaceae bacterium]|nr:hypothetical protein [Simkaniaceae bacterium]MCF7852014.1 hypothetical protein [Simkaniaceae bacterium]
MIPPLHDIEADFDYIDARMRGNVPIVDAAPLLIARDDAALTELTTRIIHALSERADEAEALFEQLLGRVDAMSDSIHSGEKLKLKEVTEATQSLFTESKRLKESIIAAEEKLKEQNRLKKILISNLKGLEAKVSGLVLDHFYIDEEGNRVDVYLSPPPSAQAPGYNTGDPRHLTPQDHRGIFKGATDIKIPPLVGPGPIIAPPEVEPFDVSAHLPASTLRALEQTDNA